jgi:hypothetical protein
MLLLLMKQILYDWVFEIATITTGAFGVVEAAAMGLLFTMCFFVKNIVSDGTIS